MPRPSKIEEHGCQEIVINGYKQGLPEREIAKQCSDWANEKISHNAVRRWHETYRGEEQATKKEIILEDRRRILKTVHQEIDIIQTNLDATKRLIERFEMVDDLPEMFKQQMDELCKQLLKNEAEFSYIDYIGNWQQRFEIELRRKVSEITLLNREVRENMKFLAQLREKAFQFELVQEYIRLFMEIFQEESKDGAYERSVVRIASNPRMKQLADQQRLFTGSGE